MKGEAGQCQTTSQGPHAERATKGEKPGMKELNNLGKMRFL